MIQNKEIITELGPYGMVVSGGGAGVPVGQQGQCLGRQAGHKVGEDKGKLKSKRTDWNP